MKLNKTMTKNNIANLSDYTGQLATESLETLNVLLEVAPVCDSEQYIKDHPDVEEFPYFQLDELNRLLDIKDTEIMLKFAKALSAKDLVTNRRLRSALDFKAKLVELTDKCVMAYVPLNDEEGKSFNSMMKQCIGHLSTFILYQFDLDATQSCIEDGVEIEANLDLVNYCDAHGKTIQDILEIVVNAMTKYKPVLPIFEEFPELEDQFLEIVGPFVQDFEMLEDYLTKEDVIKIVETQNLDLEAYVKSIESRKGNRTEELSAF